ncbi:MAG TPA: hypothetical protein VG274_00670 [Rhizomicrobium sp.]|jgi:hypothetical protein|nr:hypothetical protein [Rhizomicrobium sp.]
MNDPTITIAGREWRIPPLAPRQNRVVLPGLMRLGKEPAEQYGTLLDIVFAALTRAHPSMTREEFDDWPIATWELVESIPVIARQTGLLRSSFDRLRTRFPPHAELGEAPDWDAIIAQYVNFLPGTTPDYWEDALTATRLDAMQAEWRRHPPLALLVAGALGYRPPARDSDALEELLQLFSNGKLRLN